MRAAAYLRVSSQMQMDGHSLDAQERLFTELCQKKGWEVADIYREEGKSAHVESISKRPVFRRLLEDTAKSKFDVVVVHTLDRWSRNMKVTMESMSILAKNNVSLMSISENIDYTTPQGKLFTQMIGSFAEYFSGSLAHHVSKGIAQRAYEGKHTGGIPFGYESCWINEHGEKKRLCNPEHPGGVHVHETEGQAVVELFKRYATGNATLSQLASWMNDEGFRTRNSQTLRDANGNLIAGPKLFTTASIRGILHNPFYMGKIKYKNELHEGLHEPLISPDIFELVQNTLKKNSGRSETLADKPQREYLLKGIIRCAYCGMPMWSQTYHNGHRYYREHKASRSLADCPVSGGSVPCDIADAQINKLISAIELKPRWLEEVMTIISVKDEVESVNNKRNKNREKLRRLAKIYLDGLLPDDEYKRQKQQLQMELESLVVPQANAAEEAGKLLQDLPKLWSKANLTEKHQLLTIMLDAVYMDTSRNVIVAIKPKPPFNPVFQVAASRNNADIRIINEPYKGSSLFLVEAGESRTPRPKRTAWNILQAYSVI